MEVGSKVRFTNAEAHEEEPCFYPTVGTVGTICDIDRFGNLEVQWPEGTTMSNDRWWALEEWIEEVQQ